MSYKEFQICKRCVIDTTDSDIVFDENGYCNHCSDFIKNEHLHTYRGKESDDELDRIINMIKKEGRNKEYDCLIRISGGVDSSLLCNILFKKNLD